MLRKLLDRLNPTIPQPYDLHTHQQWQGDNLVLLYGYYYDAKNVCHTIPAAHIREVINHKGTPNQYSDFYVKKEYQYLYPGVY